MEPSRKPIEQGGIVLGRGNNLLGPSLRETEWLILDTMIMKDPNSGPR